MPKQYLSFRVEYITAMEYALWSGHGGITPPNTFGFQPGTNNGSPQFFALNNGTPDSTISDTGSAGRHILRQRPDRVRRAWRPLEAGFRRDESLFDVDWMVKF